MELGGPRSLISGRGSNCICIPSAASAGPSAPLLVLAMLCCDLALVIAVLQLVGVAAPWGKCWSIRKLWLRKVIWHLGSWGVNKYRQFLVCFMQVCYSNLFQITTIFFQSSHFPLVLWSKNVRQMLNLRCCSSPFDISGSFCSEKGTWTCMLWVGSLFVFLAHLRFVWVLVVSYWESPVWVSSIQKAVCLWAATYQEQ